MTRREARAKAQAGAVAQKVALVVRAHRMLRQMEQAVPKLDREAVRQTACAWVEGRREQWGSWAQMMSRDVLRYVGSKEYGARGKAADYRKALNEWLQVLGQYEPRIKRSWARTLPEEVGAVYGSRMTWWPKPKTERIFPLPEAAYKAWEQRVWSAHYEKQRRLKARTTDLGPWR